MLALTGYAPEPDTGEHLARIGTVDFIPGLSELVERGVLEQTKWGGYPLTYLGPEGVICEWVEGLAVNYFHSTLTASEESSSGFRSMTGSEVQARAAEALGSLDPARRIQLDLWDES